MPWIPYSSILVNENFQNTIIAGVNVAPIYRLTFTTAFPSKHRLLIGYANNPAREQVLLPMVIYPTQSALILQPQIPSIWNGLFSFYIRSFRWPESLPPLVTGFSYWLP